MFQAREDLTMEERQDVWSRCLDEMFTELHQKLVLSKVIDTKNSGSTGMLAVVHKDFVVCASLGDSQAFLFSTSETNSKDLLAKELSVVHSPDDRSESERVCCNGGTIRRAFNKYGEESGPLRVFQGHSKVPGLMMTRSFGDEIGHAVGVLSSPGSLNL